MKRLGNGELLPCQSSEELLQTSLPLRRNVSSLNLPRMPRFKAAQNRKQSKFLSIHKKIRKMLYNHAGKYYWAIKGIKW